MAPCTHIIGASPGRERQGRLFRWTLDDLSDQQSFGNRNSNRPLSSDAGEGPVLFYARALQAELRFQTCPSNTNIRYWQTTQTCDLSRRMLMKLLPIEIGSFS